MTLSLLNQGLRRLRTLRGLVALAIAYAAVASSGAALAQPATDTLRIGYQKSASLLVLLKSQQLLERRLAPLGTAVKWVEFPAGPQLLEGLNVGAVDVGFVGEAPPIFAQAAGADFVYIGFDPAAPGPRPSSCAAIRRCARWPI